MHTCLSLSAAAAAAGFEPAAVRVGSAGSLHQPSDSAAVHHLSVSSGSDRYECLRLTDAAALQRV